MPPKQILLLATIFQKRLKNKAPKNPQANVGILVFFVVGVFLYLCQFQLKHSSIVSISHCKYSTGFLGSKSARADWETPVHQKFVVVVVVLVKRGNR